jgi:hypothetical protein
MSARRLMLTAYLHAKMEADDDALAIEGCHGMVGVMLHGGHMEGTWMGSKGSDPRAPEALLQD